MKPKEQLEQLRGYFELFKECKDLIEILTANVKTAEEVLRANGGEKEYIKGAIYVDAGEIIDAIRDILRAETTLRSDIEDLERL